jgi:hypothetical protein
MRRALTIALAATAGYAVQAQAQQQDALPFGDAQAPAVVEAKPAPAAAILQTRDAPVVQTELAQQELREAEQAQAVAQQPARGSFWWVVGAIVIAGVILAVLL